MTEQRTSYKAYDETLKMIKILMDERETLSITSMTRDWYKIGKLAGAIEALQWVAYESKERLDI